MKETIEAIIKWHAETFPDATKEGQIDKFQGELKEFAATLLEPDDDDNHRTEELADMFIAACGVARFDTERATACFAVVNALKNFYLWDFGLDNAVNTKMAINRKRRWNFADGKYQHVDE